MKCAMEVLIFSYLIGQKWRGNSERALQKGRDKINYREESRTWRGKAGYQSTDIEIRTIKFRHITQS